MATGLRLAAIDFKKVHLGLHLRHKVKSSCLSGVGEDAAYLAQEL